VSKVARILALALNHVALAVADRERSAAVADRERSAAFYGAHFGLTERVHDD